MVAELVEQGPEVGPERDDPALAGGAHPELDPRQAPVLRVEALQLAPAVVRPRRQHLHPAGAHRERPGQPGEEALGRVLDSRPVLRQERGVQPRHERVELARAGQGEARDRVALAVDALLGAGQTLVVGEPTR